MAQLVEQHIRNVQVAGSSPAGSSINRQRTCDLQVRCFFIVHCNYTLRCNDSESPADHRIWWSQRIRVYAGDLEHSARSL